MSANAKDAGPEANADNGLKVCDNMVVVLVLMWEELCLDVCLNTSRIFYVIRQAARVARRAV